MERQMHIRKRLYRSPMTQFYFSFQNHYSKVVVSGRSCNFRRSKKIKQQLLWLEVMVGQHKYVVPVDREAAVPAKKKTQSSRIWILLDCTGQSTVLDVDKYDIMRRCQIHSRDLRILDPLLSYPSTIIGREKAIVLNLESLHLNSELWKPRTTELETAACPAMDELISKVRDELEQLLDDEDDMADLCLSSKVGWPIFTW